MQRRRRAGFHPRPRIPEPLHTHVTLAALAAIAALPLMLLASLPRPLVLPVLCLIAVAGAGIAALVAWRRRTVDNPRRVTAWDVAGALAFIGCAAAILSDPQQVVYLTDAAMTTSEPAGGSQLAMADRQ